MVLVMAALGKTPTLCSLTLLWHTCFGECKLIEAVSVPMRACKRQLQTVRIHTLPVLLQKRQKAL